MNGNEFPAWLKEYCNEEGVLSEKKLYEGRTFRCSTCPIAKTIEFIRNTGKVTFGNLMSLNMCNVVSTECVMDTGEIREFTM